MPDDREVMVVVIGENGSISVSHEHDNQSFVEPLVPVRRPWENSPPDIWGVTDLSRLSSSHEGKALALVMLIGIALVHVFILLALLPIRVGSFFTGTDTLFGLYWLVGCLTAVQSLRNETFRRSVASRLKLGGRRAIAAVLQCAYLATTALGFWPVVLFAGLPLGKRILRAYCQLVQTDPAAAPNVNPFTFLFSEHVTDADILKFRCGFICGCLLFVCGAVSLKSLVWPHRGLAMLLMMNASAVVLLILFNLLSGQDLRMACKRQRGPVALNLLQLTVFLICNGVVAASLLDVAVLDSTDSVLHSTLSILGANVRLLAKPTMVLRACSKSGQEWMAG